jgi:hypothetical protein
MTVTGTLSWDCKQEGMSCSITNIQLTAEKGATTGDAALTGGAGPVTFSLGLPKLTKELLSTKAEANDDCPEGESGLVVSNTYLIKLESTVGVGVGPKRSKIGGDVSGDTTLDSKEVEISCACCCKDSTK